VDREPALKFVSSPEVELAYWEWPGADPPFVFAHATGFHGRCWDYIIRQFPDRRAIAFESRSQGRSGRTPPPCHWRTFGTDLAFFSGALGIHDAIGIGHSMGGYISTLTAAFRPETYSALLLIDPTIFPRAYYGGPAPDASATRRRRNQWTSSDEMFERFRDRLPFQRWHPAIVRDYCDYALVPNGAGFELACPPEVEASIYEHSKDADADIYPEVATVRQPAVVVRAARTRKPDVFILGESPTSPDLAAQFANGREIVLADATHYIAMEQPDLVVEEIRALVGS
jgi:pimeloyl-ACP methyl ester carboxylesterase